MKTKQNVKTGKISPKDAYNTLYPLVGETYAKYLPTLKWLKNLIEGRKINLSNANQKQQIKKTYKK